MNPYVIIHIQTSLDGRIDWGLPEEGPYYAVQERLNVDTCLSTSNTMLTGFFPEDPRQVFGALYDDYTQRSDSQCEMLAVIDSGGRVKNWGVIKRQPWWRSYVTLCSGSTPADHLDYLCDEGISYIITGDEKVDLRRALEVLREQYGVRRIRTDSGGTLNGVLLRSGLVDEISLVLSPCLVGGTSPKTLYPAPDLQSQEGVIQLNLVSVEQVAGQYVWLRYQRKG